jgi:threonylcarbamoyladenosine tRNA methylthiotransferase MtaB
MGRIEAGSEGMTRAYIKIQEGCDRFCSYCLIPFARGPVRSRPAAEIVEEVRSLAGSGHREIVLTGIETAAYGRDLGYGLIELLERLEAMDGLSRIRLGSLEPSYLKPHIIDRLSKLKKPMPYYHLSLQSGTDRTLNAMKRRYNTKMVRATVNMMREKIPNVTFGSDFIVGFPGETDIDHRSTIDFVDSLEILNSHIFSYSVRPGTLAAEMKEQNSKETKEKRHKELQAVADRMQKRCIDSFIEKRAVFNVLFETHRDGYLYGYTENYIYVKVKGDPCLCGSEGRAVLTKYNEKDGMTEGELI